MKAVLRWLPVTLGLVFLISLAYIQRDRALRGANDFAQLYAGAKLAGTSGLYSRAANLEVVKATVGFTMESVVYTRPPFYAALLKPLALLPYRAAYAVFTLASMACLLLYVIRFSKEAEALPFLASMSIPVLNAICAGQDTPFLLAILGGSILLTRRDRGFLAGLLLSLAAIKFHLFLFVPVLLIMKKRWDILGGAAAGLAALTGFGCLVAGIDSIPQYVNVLRNPWINPSATITPNLHGLVAVLHGGTTMEFLLPALVLAAFVWLSLRSDNYEYLLAASLVCGLLASFHSGLSDDIILFPAFVSVVNTSSSPSLRAAAGLILTPIPYFMVLADAPYSAFFPLAMLLLLALFCVAVNGKALRSAPVAREASFAS
jgi:hypothetical protein